MRPFLIEFYTDFLYKVHFHLRLSEPDFFALRFSADRERGQQATREKAQPEPGQEGSAEAGHVQDQARLDQGQNGAG